MSRNKITRRSFLKMLGIGAAGVAVRPIMRPMPLPVDMNKQGSESKAEEPEGKSEERDEQDCMCDNPYFHDGGIAVQGGCASTDMWRLPPHHPIKYIAGSWWCKRCDFLIPLNMFKCPGCGKLRGAET